MSFSFIATGSPNDAIATVGKQAANTPQCPQAFADAVNGQLSALPSDAMVSVNCYGHTGWGEAQTSGEISLHAVISVIAARHPDAQPEA